MQPSARARKGKHLEALACGCKVVAWDRGGASESLSAGFPQGLVTPDDIAAFAQRVSDVLHAHYRITLPRDFYLQSQVDATLQVYRQLLATHRPC